MKPNYCYYAKVLDIHDGDTITVCVDCGFRMSYTTPLRFNGINAPELKTPDGKAARDYLNTLIKIGDQIVIQTDKDPEDKYGRWLAKLYNTDGTYINQTMIETKHAVPYFGGKKEII